MAPPASHHATPSISAAAPPSLPVLPFKSYHVQKIEAAPSGGPQYKLFWVQDHHGNSDLAVFVRPHA